MSGDAPALTQSSYGGTRAFWVTAQSLMIVGAVGFFLLIRGIGETVTAPVPDAGAQGPPGMGVEGGQAVLHVLLALAAVVITGLIVGRLFVYLGQPPVVGEVVAGIILGPSLLGRVAPSV